MGILIGYSTFGDEYFSDDLPSVNSITYAEFSGSIIDEISIRKTDQSTSSIKETWQSDTILLALFQNSLEAGDINNDGVNIASFKVKRRLSTDLDSIDVGEVTYSASQLSYEFYDYTQPNGNLIYTIVPVGENGLEGTPFNTNVTSSFSGIFLVDKDTNDVLAFDKSFNLGTVDSTLNQNRTILETFSKFAQVIYGQTSYETFTLTTVLLPDDGSQSNAKYLDVLNKFIMSHSPKVLKFDNGKIMVVDIGNVKSSTPTATWDGYDYTQITVDVTETQDFIQYMKGL